MFGLLPLLSRSRDLFFITLLSYLFLAGCQDNTVPVKAGVSSSDDASFCADGIDNDADGWVDAADPDCSGADAETGYSSSACNDGVDNEGDGFIDQEDSLCLSAWDEYEAPARGDIIFTEIMPNPAFVSDTLGEWFELYNTTGTSIDLLGWIVQDAAGEHVINQNLVIAADAYLVMSRSSADTNGIADASSYVFSGLSLSNSGESLSLLTPERILVAQLSYTSSESAAGVSAQLDASMIAANPHDLDVLEDLDNWCASTLALDGIVDLGSPAQANQACLE